MFRYAGAKNGISRENYTIRQCAYINILPHLLTSRVIASHAGHQQDVCVSHKIRQMNKEQYQCGARLTHWTTETDSFLIIYLTLLQFNAHWPMLYIYTEYTNLQNVSLRVVVTTGVYGRQFLKVNAPFSVLAQLRCVIFFKDTRKRYWLISFKSVFRWSYVNSNNELYANLFCVDEGKTQNFCFTKTFFC